MSTESLTKRFYDDYSAVFRKVEMRIAQYVSGTLRTPSAVGTRSVPDTLRIFAQTLFNRLMFLRFMECKGWLEFQGNKNYLQALFAAGGHGKKSFYKGRLSALFFEGLAVEGRQQNAAYGRVPYLDGGLFQPSELDRRVTDLPDDLFAALLADARSGGLFYRYDFTVEESRPADSEAAVDPEMLGKVFEESVTGRHETGSYYTPRAVVSFMCREALKRYLCDKLTTQYSGLRTQDPEKAAGQHDAIAALVDRQDAAGLTPPQMHRILAALDDLKAIDPACGSGAYLLGLLRELVLLYGTIIARSRRTPPAASTT